MATAVAAEQRTHFGRLGANDQARLLEALGGNHHHLELDVSLLLKAYLLPVGRLRATGDATLLEHVRQRAARSCPAAMTDMAVALWEGELVPKDPDGALALMRKAAEAGSPLAAFNLGQLHRSLGDADAALRWFAQCALDGDTDAQLAYAQALERGLGGELKPAEARAWYKRAAWNEVGRAGYHYGRLLVEAFDEQRLFYEGIEWLQRAASRGDTAAETLLLDKLPRVRRDAEKGNGAANTALARYCDIGMVCDLDERQIFKIRKKSVDKNSPLAYFYIAEQLNDHGDLFGFYIHTKAAAELRCEFSYFNLAICLEDGIGVQRNLVLAERWYIRAAESGDPKAFHCLGDLHRSGLIGGRANLAKAFDFYLKGATYGCAVAQFRVGSFFLSGSGVEFDAKAAFKWLSLAYDKGDLDAAYGLGLLHRAGENDLRMQLGLPAVTQETFPADPEEARIWLSLAARAGNVEAQGELATLMP
jgi:TPR repeat protein